MKIEFDGSQKMLKQIIALHDSGKNLDLSCPSCSTKVSLVMHEQNIPVLECQQCGKIWQVDLGEKSKRERIWDKFDEWKREEENK